MLFIDCIEKTFHDNGIEKEILKDISFNVEYGEFICILGPSGCGKTTLLRCIGGYEKLSSGRILINQEIVSTPGLDRIMVFQGFEQLFSWKTVKANIEYPLKINKIAKKKRQSLVQDYMQVVQLQDYADYYPHQLSGGMKQRTAIARALALEPQVLLMDEPFGNLDAQTRNTLQRELLNIWKKFNTTVVFVTHDIEEAIILADRILLMSDNPGQVKNIIQNDLPRPRKPSMEGFSEMWDLLYRHLGEQ